MSSKNDLYISQDRSGKTTNAIDYFATLGKKEGKFVCSGLENVFGDDRGDVLTPNQVLSMVITDVAVVSHADEAPDEEATGWNLLGTTEGRPDFPQIAIKRWKHLSRRDYVCDVLVCRREDTLPLGFRIIDVSLSGQFSGAIQNNGDGAAFYLAIRRFNASLKTSLLQGESFVDDICVLDSKEDLPENYVTCRQFSSMFNNVTCNLCICLHRQAPLGICDISYEYATIDRYPAKDLKRGLELPSNELPMFAFPQGLKLVYNKKQDYPLPTYFTFVFTDVKGDHLYAACLQLYELVSLAEIQDILLNIYGPNNSDGSPWSFNASLPDIDIFVPKIICVISRQPFYRAMKSYLKELYKLSLSASICPIEYFIASTVNQLPLPIPGGRSFHVVLDAALISPSSKGMPPSVFKLPSTKIFPLMDLEFSSPFKCLTIDNITAIFCLMLREAKIIFLCSSNSILTETMEILQSLLFPLTWSSAFISRLPEAVAGMLAAPGGFMIGVQTPMQSDRVPVNSFQYIPAWKKTITPGTYIVDLNKNSISQFNGAEEEQLNNTKIQQIIKTLPSSPRIRLIYRLQKCVEEYGIKPAGSRLERFDNVFDFQFDMEGKAIPKQFVSYEVRDAFLVFMTDILGEYQKYIKPPPRDLGQDTFRTFRESFEVDCFIDDSDATIRSLLTSITETQMFSVLLQQRAEGGFRGLDLFDRAVRVMRYIGLSAGGHEGSKLLNSAPDLPIPLYKLVIAEEKWVSHTGKTLNIQAKNRTVPSSAANSPLTGSGASSQMDNSAKSPAASSSSNSSSSSPSSFGSFFASISRGNSPIAAGLGIGSKTDRIVNENLDILTRFVNISLENGYFFEDQDVDDSSKVSRDEVNRSTDLELNNRFLGPLLFQGPNKPLPDTFKDFKFSDKGTTAKITSEGLFSYANGWPKLDAKLIELFHQNFNNNIIAIRNKRIHAMEEVDRSILNVVRFDSERLSHCYNSKLRSVLKGEMSHDSRLTCEETCATIAVVVDIISISLTMLSLRTSKKYKPTSDILQILGILSQIETLNLVTYLDLASWRSIFQACSSTGGDMMRRIAFLSHDTLTSSVEADCLTSGEFMRAINSVKSHKFSKFNDDTLDNFFFLEEIGNTWYVQREALNENSNQEFGEKPNSTRRKSITSNENRMSLMSSVKSNPNLKKALSASAFIEKLNLVKPSGRFAFFKPNNFYAFLRPKQASKNENTSQLFSLLNSRYEKIYNLNISIAPRAPSLPTTPSQADVNGSNKSGDMWDSATKKVSMMNSLFGKVVSASMHSPFNDSKTRDATTTKSSPNTPIALPFNDSNRSESSGPNESPLGSVKVKVVYKPKIIKTKYGIGLSVYKHESTGRAVVNKFKVLPEDIPNPCLTCDPPLRQEDVIIGINEIECSVYEDVVEMIKQSVDSVVVWVERSEDREFSDGESDNEDDEEDVEPPQPKESNVGNGHDHEMKEVARGDASPTASASNENLNADLIDFGSNNNDNSSNSNESNDQSESTSNILNFDDFNITLESSAEKGAPTSPIYHRRASDLLDLSDSPQAVTILAQDSNQYLTSISESEIAFVDKEVASSPLIPSQSASAIEKQDGDESAAAEVQNKPASSAPKTELEELISWQEDIQHMQVGDCKFAFGISSRTICTCGFAMLDEEILAAWCRLPPNKITAQFQNMLNTNALHNIHCLKCASVLVPQLHVHCYTLDRTFDTVTSVWNQDVSYLSPYCLRFELEAALEELGSDVVDGQKLYRYKPDLFWGLVWYTNRLNLPNGLTPSLDTTIDSSTTSSSSSIGGIDDGIGGIDFSTFFDYPVVTSWRKDVSCTKAGHLLRSLFAKTPQALSLNDLFPSVMHPVLLNASVLIDESNKLGGAYHFKNALVFIGKEIAAIMKAKSFDLYNSEISFERNLYLSIFSLCVICNKHKLFAHKHDDDIIMSLSKKIDFDSKFFDSIKMLSDSELIELSTTEKLLKDAIPGDGALAIRLGMGIML